MEIWLKETVTGIIVLGAVGSMLAAVIVYLIKEFFIYAFPKYVIATMHAATRFLLYFIRPSIREQAKLFVNNKPGKIMQYYSMLLAQFMLYLFMTSCLVLWLTLRVKFDNVVFTSTEIIIYVAVIIYVLFLALRKFASLVAPWFIDFDKKLEKSFNDHIEKNANN